MANARHNCLIVLSQNKDGNSAQSFIQSFTLLHTNFTVQISTPGGKPLEFIKQDDQSRRWLNEFRMKSLAIPISLQTIDPHRYSCLLIPHSPGAAFDLCNDKDLGQILKNFIQEKKPICAIGMGVAALFSANDDDNWLFSKYSLTSISIFEMAKSPDFENYSIIPEDMIKDKLASYSCSEPDEVHVVIDRHLITGQNEQSTITAVQNLILLHNQKYARKEKSPH
ncbi:glutamine amidotransferase-like class 1 domain-containing protein 1 [Trichonephila inaurata madagascariensis]|uniref:Glutamine amidotransferase-like class 1 domain-containing protein 1 n=1 Tax=Trichonephila inaurata madagascariensis TaxID=2747483 RepID=A0A8X6XSP8_9ARAC|nr:glutamine amidotransferase-like class 1 domain-containing protein 1 [Trichonephila inaurata madagascariensis]